jgi:hypothetical protein
VICTPRIIPNAFRAPEENEEEASAGALAGAEESTQQLFYKDEIFNIFKDLRVVYYFNEHRVNYVKVH